MTILNRRTHNIASLELMSLIRLGLFQEQNNLTKIISIVWNYKILVEICQKPRSSFLKNASPFTAVLRVPLFTRQRMGTRLFPELGNVKAVRKRSAPLLSYIFSGTSWLCNSQFSTRPTANVSTVYLAGTLTVLCFPPETAWENHHVWHKSKHPRGNQTRKCYKPMVSPQFRVHIP